MWRIPHAALIGRISSLLSRPVFEVSVALGHHLVTVGTYIVVYLCTCVVIHKRLFMPSLRINIRNDGMNNLFTFRSVLSGPLYHSMWSLLYRWTTPPPFRVKSANSSYLCSCISGSPQTKCCKGVKLVPTTADVACTPFIRYKRQAMKRTSSRSRRPLPVTE